MQHSHSGVLPRMFAAGFYVCNSYGEFSLWRSRTSPTIFSTCGCCYTETMVTISSEKIIFYLSIYLFIYLVGYLFYIWSTNLALFLHTAFICPVIQLYSAPSFFASLRPPFSCSLSPFLTYPQWSSFALDLGTHTSSEGSKLIRRQALTIGGLEEHFCFRETTHARAQTLLPRSSVGSRWASVRGCFIVCVFAAVCMCLPQACGYLDRLLSFFLSVQSANRTLLHALHWQLAARPAFSPNMTAASSQPCQM